MRPDTSDDMVAVVTMLLIASLNIGGALAYEGLVDHVRRVEAKVEAGCAP